MNVLKARFIATGREIQYINSIMREKAGSKALKQPALLFLISISFLFLRYQVMVTIKIDVKRCDVG